MWYYMTPNGLKPSMHDVMTKYWMPNSSDSAMNIESGFGATIAIINGEEECGGSYDHDTAAARWNYYTNFLSSFSLYAGEGGLSCA
jgi:hypothetical protein